VLLLFVIALTTLGRGGEPEGSGQPTNQVAGAPVEEPASADEGVADTTSPTASASSSVSASASAGAPVPDKECAVGKECDLGTGKVTITSAKPTKTLTAEYASAQSGNWFVVTFDYTYSGNQPATTGEIPWMLEDGKGRTYQTDTDAEITYSDLNESIIYEELNPGVSHKGKAIWQVAPDSSDFTLYVVDLVNPQGGDVARVDV
jgi:hypothetical protein